MARTFKKILIANRGEIAVRIIKTCKKMGIQTVAVYSQADQGLLHTRLADEAVCIGPFRSKESYLHIESILQAAQQTECQAIHPGYGFLSENALFSELCTQHGFTFIGPNSQQIRRMGNKTEAKLAAKYGGLPLIPGSDGALTDVTEGKKLAEAIQYPVLLKARAGGGGRGMRIVQKASEFENFYQEATMEATSAFGDGALYLEKLLTHARHIEVQVALDAYGEGIHLGVRDCSIQRKHQKLIEESPSPVLSEEFIDRLGDQVIQALKKIGYLNVGTVEFLLTPEQQYYFIEMNTRLQVEHPVTESICNNIDLVQLQIELAANHPMPWSQKQIQRQGHSIECRINAEDPRANFKPSPGRITRLQLPQGEHIRVDTFLEEGIEIPPHYDSLIAKVIVFGQTREDAIQKMIFALDHFHIEGISTTIPFHRKMMERAEYVQGDFYTRFLEERGIFAEP